MYTIGQAAARSGLTVPTLRVWERRYGVVHPARTPSGYRLYDENAINRLLAMRYLIDVDGVRPSQAAGQLRDEDVDVDALVEAARVWWARGGTPAPAPAGTGDVALRADTVESLLAAARTLDTRTLDARLDDAFAAERFEGAIDHVVFPALRAIGDGWADGSVDVAMEHAASEVVRRRLSHFYDAAGGDGGQPDVIVGLPPGSQHDIGIFTFAVAARRAGLAVLYLGGNVPIDSWARAITTSRARVAVMGVVTGADIESAARVVAAVHGLADGPHMLLGGASARRVAGIAAADVLPDRIDDAVAVVVRHLGRNP